MANQLKDVERNLAEAETAHAEASARRDDLASELTAGLCKCGVLQNISASSVLARSQRSSSMYKLNAVEPTA
jgi:hypothetical protein